MFPFLRGPGLGAVSLLIEFGGQWFGRGQLGESPEDVLDQRRFLRIDEQLLSLPVHVVAEDGRAATVLSPPLGHCHFVPDAFGDDLPFVLGEGDQNAQKHTSGGVGGIEVLGYRDKADPLLVEPLDHLHEVQQRTREAVDLVHHDRIHLPRIHVGQQTLQSGALHVGAGESTVAVRVRQYPPALHALAFDVGLGRLPLSIQRIELLIEAFLVALAGINGTTDQLPPGGVARGDIRHAGHLACPSSARRRACRSTACR